MIINTNMASLNTVRQLGINEKATRGSLEKLSSGLRINSAADDAAGLAISEKMRGQISGLNQASSNAQNGISLVSTAEGALNETTAVLQRMRELAVAAGNDTNTTADRTAMQTETNALVSAINDIGNQTEFNTQKLLTGTLGLSTDDGANLSNLGQTANTKAGTLTFTASATMAKAASGTLTLAGGATTASGNGSLDIVANGKTFNVGFTAGQQIDDLAKNITAMVSGYTAAFDSSTGKLTLTSNEANADQTITIAESGVAGTKNLDGATDFTAATGTKNADSTTAQNAVTSTNASGLAAAGTGFTYYGNNVTVSSGNQTGLSFTLQADAGSTTAATVSGKSITAGSGLTLQIGANKDQTMTININAMDAANLGVANVDLTTQTGAENALKAIDTATATVSAERSKLGAFQNRLEHN